MNNKLPVSAVAQMMSARSGRSRKECEDLLRNFFQTISSALLDGEIVKIKGFGTFKVSWIEARKSVDINNGEDFEIPAHDRIVFLPSKELATAVNAPFEMFETIELDDTVSVEELLMAENTEELEIPEKSVESEKPENPPDLDESESSDDLENSDESQSFKDFTESVISEITEETAESEESVDSAFGQTPEGSQTSMTSAISGSSDNLVEESSSEESDLKRVSARKFRHGFFWGIVAALLVIVAGIGIIYWLNEDSRTLLHSLSGGNKVALDKAKGGSTSSSSDLNGNIVAEAADGAEATTGMDDIVEDVVAEKDTDLMEENVAPTAVSGNPVYDTITPATGLGTLARKHYGHYDFWPYIYKENEKILGHPDRIRPGTRVIIPPLAKYGVDPKKPADAAKARRMDVEIYARYKNAIRKK